ncbi:hypothetical protein [Stenotrophomonas maltophilia]|uniref:hypothetical protein n=1 Tax=Stenotrophomonas maltophilia TaxID=40324 RepID=UPI001EF80B16|nr:hypothetical protein [Stenotrophomonas maltophilia]
MVIEFLGRMRDMQRYDADDTQVYRVRGQVFFASAGPLGCGVRLSARDAEGAD